MTQWCVLCPHSHVPKTATCPVRESASARVGNPRVGVSASCPVTYKSTSYLLTYLHGGPKSKRYFYINLYFTDKAAVNTMKSITNKMKA